MLAHPGHWAEPARGALPPSPPPTHRAEYVCYTELVRTAKRPYMAGLTGIEPQWLPDVAAPLCTFSQPLPDPPPFYKAATDQVGCRPREPGTMRACCWRCLACPATTTATMHQAPQHLCAHGAPFTPCRAPQVLCWRDVTFSRHDWQLPRCTARHPDPNERCAVFGAALLEGKVLPSFAGALVW